MPHIFIAIIFVFFLPLSTWADSFFQLNFSGFEKSAFFQGVEVIQFITIIICFLIGPFQFIPKLYRKNPMLHFALGNVYTMVILLLAGPATVILAIGQNSIIGGVFLAFLGALCWWSTRKGIFYISNKKWLLHLEWMFSSYLSVFSICLLILIKDIWIVSVFFFLAYAILLFLRQKKIHHQLLKAFLKSGK